MSFTSLVRVTPIYIICDYYEECCFPDLILSYMSFAYRTATDFFVSSYFAEGVYQL